MLKRTFAAVKEVHVYKYVYLNTYIYKYIKKKYSIYEYELGLYYIHVCARMLSLPVAITIKNIRFLN